MDIKIGVKNNFDPDSADLQSVTTKFRKIYTKTATYKLYADGEIINKTHQSKRITETGYLQNLSHFEAQNCKAFPLRSQCFKNQGNRYIERNHILERRKQKTREPLLSEKGIHKKNNAQPMYNHYLLYSNIIMDLDDFL